MRSIERTTQWVVRGEARPDTAHDSKNRGYVEDRYVPRSGTKTCLSSLASLRSKIGTKAAEPPAGFPSGAINYRLRFPSGAIYSA